MSACIVIFRCRDSLNVEAPAITGTRDEVAELFRTLMCNGAPFRVNSPNRSVIINPKFVVCIEVREDE